MKRKIWEALFKVRYNIVLFVLGVIKPLLKEYVRTRPDYLIETLDSMVDELKYARSRKSFNELNPFYKITPKKE